MTNIIKDSGDPLVVWRFTDGKPGHESQTFGLVSAISELREVVCYDFYIDSKGRGFAEFALGSFRAPESAAKPDFIVGAGHSTHWSLLAAKRVYGGQTVVLMKPSLPLSWFNHCVIPKHDRPPVRSNVTITEGVLNPIRPAQNASDRKGLILIGGESQHYEWDDACIVSQLDAILESNPGMKWTLTTSRRTPDSTVRMLLNMGGEKLTVVPHSETPQGWVAEQLQLCGEVWVTPDSMSMLYEAMSASSKVGIFRLQAKRKNSRVVRAIEGLISKQRLSLVNDGRVERPDNPLEPLSEASRVASIILRVV